MAAWIAASANHDDPPGQRQAWHTLRRLGGRAVPPIERAMERSTDPFERSRIGLAFSFMCVDALPAIREAERNARSEDVKTTLGFTIQRLVEADSLRRGGKAGTAVGC